MPQTKFIHVSKTFECADLLNCKSPECTRVEICEEKSSTRETEKPTRRWVIFIYVMYVALCVSICSNIAMVVAGVLLLSKDSTETCMSDSCGPGEVLLLTEKRQYCESESALWLLNIMITVKNMAVTKAVGELDDPFSRRHAVNFILNKSSTPELGLIWRKPYQSITDGDVTNFIIPETGRYVLYSMATISSMTKENHIQRDDDVHHQLLRTPVQRQSAKEVLFERRINVKSKYLHYHSSVLFGSVFLEKGDEVYPTVSDVSKVYKMSATNSWGTFALSAA